MMPIAMTVLGAAAVAGLAADFTLLVDDREIVAQGSASDFSGFDFSSDDLLPDLPFEDWFIGAGGFGAVKSADGSGSSSQNSTISTTALLADGNSSASAFSDGEGYGLGFAYSRFGVRFSVAETARVRVQAQLDASGEARAWVRLFNGDNDRLVDEDAADSPRDLDFTRALPPGDYTFQLRNDATAVFNYEPGSSSASASYDGSLTLAPGCNGADTAAPEGVLDLADVQAFITAFTSANPLESGNADLANPSDILDLADIQAFVTLFTAGCP